MLILLLLLSSLSLGSISCSDSEVYMKAVKVNDVFASEESFNILYDKLILFTSPIFANEEIKTMELCLSRSINRIYTIVMKDEWEFRLNLITRFNDGWTGDSSITIYGENGNIAFKSYLTTKQESFDFSLYTPITQKSSWKFKNSFDNFWNQLSFIDSSWQTVKVPSQSLSTTGTQYFRKLFNSTNNMVAYEIQFRYRYGIVSYINGLEIFRDNLPTTDITESTTATGSYSTEDLRGVVRPAKELASNSVLAVEIHFLTAVAPMNITFDAFIATYLPTIKDNPCYVMPTYSSVIGEYPDSSVVMDWNRLTFYPLFDMSNPQWFRTTFSKVYPVVNALRLLAYSNILPSSVKVSGSMAGSTGSFSPIIHTTDRMYNFQTIDLDISYNANKYYKYYRIDFLQIRGSYTPVADAYLLVCSFVTPTSITFTQSTYSGIVNADKFKIYPLEKGISSCQLTPTLPTGLSFDSLTCTVSGVLALSISPVVFNMTSNILNTTLWGSFTIESRVCDGILVGIERSYGLTPQGESFLIFSNSNTETVYEEKVSDVREPDTTEVTKICIQEGKYTLKLLHSTSVWCPGSHVHLFINHGNDIEWLVFARYDSSHLVLPFLYPFSLIMPIKLGQSWNYLLGSLPDLWYSSSLTGWSQSIASSIPVSSNQIKLVKKIITLNDLTEANEFILNIKYKYGIIVYINGKEVFKNNLADTPITSQTMASSMYSDVIHRLIALPISTVKIGNTEIVHYFVEGNNVISVGLFAPTVTTTSQPFDLDVRLLYGATSSRVLDATVTASGFFGDGSAAFDDMYTSYLYQLQCNPTSIVLVFNKDRREWISSVSITNHVDGGLSPHYFTLQARNRDTEAWTTLLMAENLQFWTSGLERRLYVENNRAYNQFRWSNFRTESDNQCSGRIQRLALYSDPVDKTVAELEYTSPIDVYVNIEMAEVFPHFTTFKHYTVKPELPHGIILDPYAGVILGTPMTPSAAVTHTITAVRFDNTETTTTVVISVITCSGNRSLVTATTLVDNFAMEYRYRLYEGPLDAGTPISSLTGFPIANALVYFDFCLLGGIYTLQFADPMGDGWMFPSHYRVTMDVGQMILDVNYMCMSWEGESIALTTFTSTVPFQINFSMWRVGLNFEEIPAGWAEVDYDDSVWKEVLAKNIGHNNAITTYIRKSFTISDSIMYYGMNVRVRYSGGISVYFNNRKVARFNLAGDAIHSTYAIALRDASLFSKFHILLREFNSMTGTNVISFEIHRSHGMVASDPVEFDATGVFIVQSSGMVHDSVTTLDCQNCDSSSERIFDMNPATTVTFDKIAGSSVTWEVENLEGSRFSYFGIYSEDDIWGYGFSLFGRNRPEDDWVMIHEARDAIAFGLMRTDYMSPLGLIGFKQFKWVLNVPSDSTITVPLFSFAIYKETGAMCPGLEQYLSVPEGFLSPALCPAGYSGYLYRNCKNGMLGEEQMDRCVLNVPKHLKYDISVLRLVTNINVAVAPPSFEGIASLFRLDEHVALPKNLVLDPKTGAISGIPEEVSELATYSIYAVNDAGIAFTSISISVRVGMCMAEGSFPVTLIGETAKYECGKMGGYIGTQTRPCVNGEGDGKWGEINGVCVSIGVIVLGVVFVIVVVAVVGFVVFRITKKRKTVGGIKSKKTTVKTTAQQKTKEVKV